jgi:sec-independent protein translocase protein TatC
VRAGLVTPEGLRHNRRYAVLACAAIAALLPGDAFTMVLETVPLYLLYEASILVASVIERAERRGRTAQESVADPAEATTKTAQEMIDHTDPDLS